jgi:hypothetical protein
MSLLERELVITWIKTLCRYSPQTDWIGVTMKMTEDEDERLAKYLLFSFAFNKGWRP